MLGQLGAFFTVGGRILRRPRGQAVDVAVVHGESGSNEHRVMNLDIVGTFAARALDILRRNIPPADADLVGNCQKGFELCRNRCTFRIVLDIPDEFLVPVKMIGSDRAMNFVSKEAVVARGNIRGD